MTKQDTPRNRNGAIGDFASYAQPKRSMDELIEQAIRKRRGEEDPEPVGRVSTTLLESEGYRLVRYRIGSRELAEDMTAVAPETGKEAGWYAGDRSTYTAVFGVVGPDDTVQAAFDVMDHDGKSDIFMAYRAPAATVPNEVVRDFLNHLDVPASWRGGADATIENLFDLNRERGSDEWKSSNPVHVVVMGYERICFAVTPVMREHVDVMLAPEPGQNLSSPDADHVYWAKDFYRNAGFERLHEIATDVRPGFSSWMPKGDPVLAKVVRKGLERELAGIFPEPESTAEAEGPRAPGR